MIVGIAIGLVPIIVWIVILKRREDEVRREIEEARRRFGFDAHNDGDVSA